MSCTPACRPLGDGNESALLMNTAEDHEHGMGAEREVQSQCWPTCSFLLEVYVPRVYPGVSPDTPLSCPNNGKSK